MPVSFFFFFCLSSPADPEQTRTTLPDAGWDCTSIIFRSDLLSPWIPALSTLGFPTIFGVSTFSGGFFHLFHIQDTQGRPVLPDQPYGGGRAIDLYREFISLRYPALFRRRAAGQPARRLFSFVLSCFWVSCLFCWMVSKSVFVRFGIRWRTIRIRILHGNLRDYGHDCGSHVRRGEYG